MNPYLLYSSEKLYQNLLAFLSNLSDKLDEILKSYDISFQQYQVLTFLSKNTDKVISMSNISSIMIDKCSNTTRIVNKLVDKKFVGRELCTTNRRMVEVWITEEGKIFLEKMSSFCVDCMMETVTNKQNITKLDNIVTDMKKLEELLKTEVDKA